MLIMIMMVGIMITVMEMMNVITVSWLLVLSVLLIIHPSNIPAYPVQGHRRAGAFPSMH